MFNFMVSRANGQATLYVEDGLQYSINFDTRGVVSMIILEGWVVLENITYY